MICAVINGPSLKQAFTQINKVKEQADLVELRLDHFNKINLSELSALKNAFSIPMIFTLRSKSQGGNYMGSEEKRHGEIRRLATLGPEFLDLESHVPIEFVREISNDFPKINLIISSHDFNHTPQDLDLVLNQMIQFPCTFMKIAMHANSSLDSLRLLCHFKGMKNVIPVSMGANGQVSRVLAPITNGSFSYAAVEEVQQTAPGQLTVDLLANRYHIQSLNLSTRIYGLIGDPVDLSVSDITHNQFFHQSKLNAVYVKIPVKQDELKAFLDKAKCLPFHGLSVTMPLKEAILLYLDAIDPEALAIGAVNTLCFKRGVIKGYNTDGIGALNTIEKKMSIKGKRTVIIGAGGTAKAIAFEACQRGASLTILNRNKERAMKIADQFHCRARGLNEMASCFNEGYDILINATPCSMPIEEKYILPKAIIMDVNNRPQTDFLSAAVRKGCRVIHGHEMFMEQALGQFSLWFEKIGR